MNKKKYFVHLVSSYSQLIVGMIIPLLLTPYMVNKLGSEEYGLWVLLSSVIAYFGLSNLGFGTTLLKEVSQNKSREHLSTYVSTTIGFFMLISSIVFFVFLVVMLNLDNFFLITDELQKTAEITFTLLYFIFLVSFLSSAFNTLLFAKGMLHIQSAIGIVQSIVTALLIFAVLYAGHGIVMIATVNLVMALVGAVTVATIASKRVDFSLSRKYFDWELLKKMASPSMHYFFISIAVLVVFYTDNIIISSFMGLGAVAVYSIGYKLVDVAQKLLFKIVDVLLPNVAALYGDGKYREVLSLHNKLLAYTLLLGIPGYGILFFYGVDILKLWVGNKYAVDETILRVFVLFAFSHSWVHVSGLFIAAMGVHKTSSYIALTEAVLNIILSLILLHYYGLLGVALGTLFAGLLTSSWFGLYWFYKMIYRDIENQKRIQIGEV